MIAPVHFVSISGGKDSTATACLALERAQRQSMDLRFIFADTGNEHEITLDHVAYLAHALGIQIETVRADFTDKFAARREAIARDWPKELRRKQHTRPCLVLCKEDIAYAERAALREQCDCPTKISPALPDEMVRHAIDLMHPTGNPFLDMAMLHGRFPGSQSRFCTDELKLQPMEKVKDIVRLAGVPIVEWIGERAEESTDRAAKPVLERVYCALRAPSILYRPVHAMTAADMFTIAGRHGLRPNPLYLMGMKRVGCMPCIMCGKEELRQIALRFPEHIDRIESWEVIVGGVARHAYSALLRKEQIILVSSFLPTDKLPPDGFGKTRATIRRAVEWSMTGRGGRNFDLFAHADMLDAPAAAGKCASSYGLCE